MFWLLLRRFLPQLLLLGAIVGAGLYLVHLGYARRDAKAQVEFYELDQKRLAALFDHQMDMTVLARRYAAIDNEVIYDLRPRLAAAGATAAALTRRVLDYQASAGRCAVPAAAAGAGGTDGAGGESGDARDLEAAAARVREAAAEDRAACARDAGRLTAWQKREELIQTAQP